VKRVYKGGPYPGIPKGVQGRHIPGYTSGCIREAHTRVYHTLRYMGGIARVYHTLRYMGGMPGIHRGVPGRHATYQGVPQGVPGRRLPTRVYLRVYIGRHTGRVSLRVYIGRHIGLPRASFSGINPGYRGSREPFLLLFPGYRGSREPFYRYSLLKEALGSLSTVIPCYSRVKEALGSLSGCYSRVKEALGSLSARLDINKRLKTREARLRA